MNITREIKLDTEQILQEIERLREQLPKNDRNNFMLDRYLDHLTSYAETVAEEDGQSRAPRRSQDSLYRMSKDDDDDEKNTATRSEQDRREGRENFSKHSDDPKDREEVTSIGTVPVQDQIVELSIGML